MVRAVEDVNREIAETRAALDSKIARLGERAGAVVEPFKDIDRQRVVMAAGAVGAALGTLVYRRRRRRRATNAARQRALELVPAETALGDTRASGRWLGLLLPLLELALIVGYGLLRGQTPIAAARPALAHVGAAARASIGRRRSG